MLSPTGCEQGATAPTPFHLCQLGFEEKGNAPLKPRNVRRIIRTMDVQARDEEASLTLGGHQIKIVWVSETACFSFDVLYSWGDSLAASASLVAPPKPAEEPKDISEGYREGINAVLPSEVLCMILKEASAASPYLMHDILSLVCKLWRDLTPRKKARIDAARDCWEAAGMGWLPVLQWLRGMGCPWDHEVFVEAARRGHMPVLLWAKENGCPSRSWRWSSGNIFKSACESGDVDLVQWVLKEEIDDADNSVTFEDGCGVAALRGHLPLLQSMTVKNPSYVTGRVCLEAAKGGSVGVLTWAKENGAPWTGEMERRYWRREYGCTWEETVCREAAERGHIQVLQWLKENCECKWKSWPCEKAAWGGKLEVLKWLREQGCPWHPDICANAAERGHLEVMKWAIDQGCTWSPEDVLNKALKFGDLEMLQYCSAAIPKFERYFTTTSIVTKGAINRIETAAGKGQLETIRWFLEKLGFDPDILPPKVCAEAARSGNVKALKYLRSWGVPWDETVCLAAADGDHLTVLEWCRRKGAPWNSSLVAHARSTKLLRWALDHGVPVEGI